MRRIYTFFCLMFAVAIGAAQSEYVNPLVGTAEHGHTFPGAIVPFGAIQVSPDTRLDGWDGCSGYHYTDNRIYGFSHNHLNGTGVSDYGDVMIMPFMGTPYIHNEQYAVTFSHQNESATAGYYSVWMDNDVMVELTSGQYVAMHRISFPKKGRKGFIIDLTHRDKVLSAGMSRQGNELTGFRCSEAWNPNQYCAFSIIPSAPIVKVEYYYNDTLTAYDDVRGENCKAIVYFADTVRTLTLKVAISAVDVQGARNNQKEVAHFNFDQLRKEARMAWDRELGKIQVESKNVEDSRIFYTALYHCFTSPFLFSDLDGRYRGQDGAIHQTQTDRRIYTVFSLWDTYRALHPLLNIIDQKRTADFLYTFMQHYREGGMLPVWELSAYETWCMIGYHSVPVILDAYLKGIHPYDEREMLKAMVHSATLNKLGRREYAEWGYVPGDADNESVSKTLEYAFDDWCIAQFAKLIGEDAIYKEFSERACSYRNLLDPNGFMHGKVNGGFVTPFDPTEVNNFYTEANSWQYSTYAPHDIPAYLQLMGGRARMESFLDSLFHSSSAMTGRDQSDITGVIGQYAHGNEPSHHAVYLYNYVQRYDKTVELTQKIMRELYSSAPDGLCGNEDCGQMSAWYVLSSLGFYPVCPGSNRYDLGCPVFDKATVSLENGKSIVVRKKGKGQFVASVLINGKPVTSSDMTFTFDEIKDGGEIVFCMSDKQKLTMPAPQPKAVAITPLVPYFSTDQKCFNGELVVEILQYRPVGRGAVYDDNLLKETEIYYTLDGSTPTPTQGVRYTKPLRIQKNTVLKAIAYHKVYGTSKVATAQYTLFNKDKSLTYTTVPNPQYYAGGDDGLIDGLRGKVNWRVGGWQGFPGDFEAVIDLLGNKSIHAVTASCLEDVRAWIFFPSRVEVLVSEDGTNYKPFGSTAGIGSEKSEDAKLHAFEVRGEGQGRYLKVRVSSYGKLPNWHVSAGQQSWLFMDEIMIDAD